MRFVIHPVAEPYCEVDITDRLAAAIAEELWKRYGGNKTIYWVEAERHLHAIIEDARTQAKQLMRAGNVA